MLHQEDLTFQMWTLSFKLNHLKTLKPTFTDQAEQVELARVELVLLCTTKTISNSSGAWKIELVSDSSRSNLLNQRTLLEHQLWEF